MRTLKKIVATLGDREMELGPFYYPNPNVDIVLESVKLGKTSAQKGVPAPDARLVDADG